MGIDRPDVETVIHADIPGPIEAYYQEIGRAGRDGRPAAATLLWNYADVKTREFLIDHGREEQAGRHAVAIDPVELKRRKQLEHKKLRCMVAYANTTACLRAAILRYFGDPAARDRAAPAATATMASRLTGPDACWFERSCRGSQGRGRRTDDETSQRCWSATPTVCPRR